MKKKKNNSFLIIMLVSCLVVPGVFLIVTQQKKNSDVDAQMVETQKLEIQESEIQESEIQAEASGAKPEVVDSEISEELATMTTEVSEKTYSFEKVDKSYFDDALFIGDSRTLGISEYGSLDNATFFASSGMTVYNATDDGKLEAILKGNTFGKIYLMLGINELGYDQEQTLQRYGELVNQIRTLQPGAILYIEANLHVTAERVKKDELFNNENINRYNSGIQKLVDNENIFYLDVNELFDDEDGNLNQEYSHDDTHPLGKYYQTWCEWLMEHAIVK